MIRPFTLITMLLAAGAGAYLFAVKHHAQMLDDQIADVSQGTRLDAQRIIVLQAQWALETRPTRLQHLASQFTDLQPMQPAQLVTLAALTTALPAPGSAQPGANPELPGGAQPQLVVSAAQPNLAQPNAAQPIAVQPGSDGARVLPLPALPLPPPQAPVNVATVSTAPAVQEPKLFPKRFTVRTARRVNHSSLAAGAPAYSVPNDRALPVQVSAPMLQYHPAATPVSADNSGSALGMAADLPPPQPLSGQSN